MLNCNLPLIAALACSGLAACGGGGGGGGSPGGGITTPAPPTTPTPLPTPTNLSLAALTVSQTFLGDAASSTSTVSLPAATIASSSAVAGSAVTVRYDMPSNSYILSAPGRTETFGPGDRDPASTATFLAYSLDTATSSNAVIISREGGDGTTHVAHGFWLRATEAGGVGTLTFDGFAFGMPSTAAAVPRVGAATYATELSGLLSAPGQTFQILSGTGDVIFDFASGRFSYDVYPTQFDAGTGGSLSGGSIRLQAGGTINSAANSFSGRVTYDYSITGSPAGSVAGDLQGRFYGPAAGEVGASFAATNAAGASLAGAFSGARTDGAPQRNLSLANVISPELFYAPSNLVTSYRNGAGYTGTDSNLPTYYQVHLKTNGFQISSGVAGVYVPTPFTPADIVAGQPNFTTYTRTQDGSVIRAARSTNPARPTPSLPSPIQASSCGSRPIRLGRRTSGFTCPSAS